MIQEVPIKLDKHCIKEVKNIFLTRKRIHYKYVGQNFKKIMNFWQFYLYIAIGIIGGILLFSTVIMHSEYKIRSELNLICLSAVFFFLTFQFSIKYFYHPADLIHFKHRKEIMLKIRKYAIIHAVFFHLISWAILLVCFSPLYFYLTNKSILNLICLLFFSVSFTLATSMIRKEAKINLRESLSRYYPLWYTLLSVTMLIWYVTIFCFADYLYILVGTCVNLFIFFYSYKWGNHLVMDFLSSLIDSDTRHNMLSATAVGLLQQYETKVKMYRNEPLIIKSTSRLFRSNHYKTVLLEIILKRLLRTNSYLLSMLLFYIVFAIGLFTIEDFYQFVILSLVTLYISFLIHKHHVEYFYTYTLMRSYVKEGVNIKHIDIKITLLLTLPVIALKLVGFILFC